MTKRAASLFIGLWLLAAATSASAECAWVLWVIQGIRVDHLVAAYPMRECVTELDHLEQTSRADNTLLATRSARTSLNITDKVKATFSTTYQ